jgi:hypothetical protein
LKLNAGGFSHDHFKKLKCYDATAFIRTLQKGAFHAQEE